MPHHISPGLLVIGDLEKTTRPLCAILHNLHFPVVRTRVDDAFSQARGTRPDIVIVDVASAALRADICGSLKSDATTALIPVLAILPGNSSTENRASALDSGAEAFVMRPVRPALLAAHIRALMRLGHSGVAYLKHSSADQQRDREFVQKLLNNASIGIAIVQGPDLRFALANPAFRSIWGSPDAPIVGHTVREVFPAALVEAAQTGLDQVLRSGRPRSLRQFEAPPCGERGTTWWNADYIPLFEASGRVESVLVLVQDVTEPVQARQAAESANEAKDHFLAIVSHELRTPLMPVLAAADVLLRNAHLPHSARADLEVIRRNVQMQSRIVSDLLDLTRIVRGKLEMEMKRVDARWEMRRAIETCAGELGPKKLRLKTQIARGPCTIRADPARLQQVLCNILNNAIKFTPAGGRITARCACVGRRVVLEVSDTGMGIEPEAVGRIFEPFQQEDRGVTRRFGGLGLGLAICKGIVAMLGGAIRATSEGRGKGATFTIELPLIHGEAEMPSTPRASRHRGAAKRERLRILLVEDHADTARMMCRLLLLEGHEVRVAANRSRALELAAHHEFDLLVSDLELPDGSGLDLMRQLHEQRGVLRGIALTGYGRSEDRQRSREAGFTEHLVKPVSLEMLQSAIARAAGADEPHPTTESDSRA